MRGIIIALLVGSVVSSGCAHSTRGRAVQASLVGGATFTALGWGVSSFIAQPSPFIDNDTDTTRMDHARTAAHVFEVTTILCLATAIAIGVADQGNGASQ